MNKQVTRQAIQKANKHILIVMEINKVEIKYHFLLIRMQNMVKATAVKI